MRFRPIELRIIISLLMIFGCGEVIAQATKGQTFRTHTFTLSRSITPDTVPKGSEKIAFLGNVPFQNLDKECKAAFGFLKSLKGYYPVYLSFDELLKNPKLLDPYKFAWFHKPDTLAFSFPEKNQKIINRINAFLKKGGNLLLTLNALHYLNILGIEPVAPNDSVKPSIDDGNGRKLGIHSFLNHPVFDGMFGGSYVMMPVKDTSFWVSAYYGKSIPKNGKVIGVDWDYIFLREDSKLMLEYTVGKGRVIAVGGYTCFSVPNMNRNHLERFIVNIFNYFSAPDSAQDKHYWNYTPYAVYPLLQRSKDTNFIPLVTKCEKWDIPSDSLTLVNRFASGDYWDVAGERMLTMGTEKGGIEEIWTHPFMAFRDYEAGLKFEYKDTVFWLKDERPDIQITPSCFIRTYKFPRAYLKEIIANDPVNPNGVIHYEYNGVDPAGLIVKIKSNLRLMWPYSEKVLGSMGYCYDTTRYAFRVQDHSETFTAMIGANRKPDQENIGQYSGFNYNPKIKMFEGTPSKDIMVSGVLSFPLKMNDCMDVVYTATNQGETPTMQSFDIARKDAWKIYDRARIHTDSLLSHSLTITSPDLNFNKGYLWALIGTDRFFVNTPGMGKSLVAGYSTTRTGWDGGQKINGRPGYGWYFGRDGEWSGFTLLDYGDFQKVKSELEFYAKYQDLSGKIFHEATTSGVIHYDAADATPLYIVLAGKYFRHSQDTTFLHKNWPAIKKAVEFCYSTDTDHDHLIENTNVGHGWVEGGELYGSHATIYMQGCWAAALEETANMAYALKQPEAESYSIESGTVKRLINTLFWNPKTKYYSYGMNKDRTFRTEATVLSSVPLYFKTVNPEYATPVLAQLAGNAFSTNWGTRIIREDSPFFKPTGYHYGSVWPLFTGWTALAEYTYGNYPQGFFHIMNNLNIYKNWGKGFVEEVMNGASYEPSGVCPHQCWSETMVLQPAIEGMLGINIIPGENKIVLSPHFPAGWDSVSVRNIRIGNSIFDLCMKRTDESYFYTFTPHGTQSINIEFSPTLPAGTKFNSVLKDGNDTPFTSFNDQKRASLLTTLKLIEPCMLQVDYQEGIEVIPEQTDPKPGDRSEGMRIISTRFSGYKYFVDLEGVRKTSRNIEVLIHGQEIEKIENGELKGNEGDIYHIEVTFEPGDSKYLNKTVIIYLKQGPASGDVIPVQGKEPKEKKKKEKKETSPKCPRWN
jgi:glycogen debranching enzyme